MNLMHDLRHHLAGIVDAVRSGRLDERRAVGEIGTAVDMIDGLVEECTAGDLMAGDVVRLEVSAWSPWRPVTSVVRRGARVAVAFRLRDRSTHQVVVPADQRVWRRAPGVTDDGGDAA